MRFNSVLGVLFVHAIVVTRRIALAQFWLLFYVMMYCFLAFASVCMYVYVLDLSFGVAIVSRR